MLLPCENNPKTWLFLTILISVIIALSETKGVDKFNIKIGFDLTQGSNGAHSVRIRDFEDSAEYNPRAVDDASSSNESSNKKKTGPKAESSESVERERAKKEDSSKEPKPAKSKSNSDDDDVKSSASQEDKLRSTRGLKAADFEPEEENPKIHARYQKKNSESDAISDESAGRRRY